MSNDLLIKFISELQPANAEIIHNYNNYDQTTISYNKFTDISSMTSKLSESFLNLETTLLTELIKNEHAKEFIAQMAKNYLKDVNNIFPSEDGFIINRNINITDNIKGKLEFFELSDKHKAEISKRCCIQKEYLVNLLNSVIPEHTRSISEIFPFRLNGQNTDLTALLLSMSYANFFVPDYDNSTDCTKMFIHSFCDALGIKRIDNLNQLIKNVKSRVKIDSTHVALAEALKKGKN